MIKGMKWWLNIDIKVIGELPPDDKVVIYAIKHQSAWETVFCTDFFSMPSQEKATIIKSSSSAW